MTVGDIPEFGFTAADAQFTVQAWVNFTAFTGSTCTLASKYGTGSRRGWSVGIHDDVLQMILSETGAARNIHMRSLDTVTTGRWYFIAYTVDVATDTFEIYLDGEPLAVEHLEGDSIDTINPNTAHLTIGAVDGTGGSGDHLRAYIDEVRIFDRARSAEEIAAEYEALCGGGSCLP